MAATSWSPAPYLSKQEWLLADGSIVVSPDLESSGSGRRVRVIGHTESVGSRQVDTLIQASIDKVATDRGTQRLIRLFPELDVDALAANSAGASTTVFDDALTLHLLNQNHRSRNQRTAAVWKFQRADGPIEAYVFISLYQSYAENYQVQTHVIWRDTRALHANDLSLIQADGNRVSAPDMYIYSAEAQSLQEWFTQNSIVSDEEIRPGSTAYNGQMRNAVVRFADLCKRFDQFDSITLPDSENATNSHVFKRTKTNFSASFYSELLGFVQTGPTLERIQENFKQLMDDIGMLGVVVRESMNDNDLAAAVNGDVTKIRATVLANEDEDVDGSSIDPHHTVTFDFATGSVVVNCDHAANLDETAQQWEIAKFKAEVAGELDALYAYAQAVKDPVEQKRLKKILKQRKTPEIT